MFSFYSKKVLQSRAEELIITARIDADLANKTDYFDTFMEYYNELLSCAKELYEISEKIQLKGISGNPSTQYYRLRDEQQWHMRDAMERQYNRIVSEGTTIYRNNSQKNQNACRFFLEDLEKYLDAFDEETKTFASNLLRKLSSKFGVDVHFQSDNSTVNPNDLTFDFDSLEGHDFEFWCANLLRCNGFSNVEVTQGSGDQGVDILAEKDDIRYAIQCKCYSSDLGNSPVQEVWAGKNLYHCHIAAVMTNRYFTKGAQELAKSTGVLLWDRSKILKMLNLQ